MKKINFRWSLFLILLVLLKCTTATPESIDEPVVRQLPNQETDTPTPTITLTPTPTLVDTNFFASIYEDTSCFSGTGIEYQELTKIPRGKIVIVLGVNERGGNWFLVRWKDFTTDCWVEGSKLVPDFEINILTALPTPFPPTFTSTPTQPLAILEPTKTHKPNDPNLQAQTAQALTAQAAQAQTAAALAKAQTAAALAKTVQAQTSQAQTAAALAQTSQAQTAVAQAKTVQALTAQAAYIQTLTCMLSAPHLNATSSGQNVHLSWNSVQGATSYEVFRSVNGGEYLSIGTTNKDSIPNKTTHAYYVVAKNSCGIKAKSNTKTIAR
jgi:hypothetical protein